MVKPAAVAAVLLAVPALALSACSPHQNPSSSPGTNPPVWTGSTSPSASLTQPANGDGQKLTAQLSTADGKPVADGDVRLHRWLCDSHRRDDRRRHPDSRLPRDAHPCGRQVRAELGGPDGRSARRLLVRRWTLPGARSHHPSRERRPQLARGPVQRRGEAGHHHRRVHRRAAARRAGHRDHHPRQMRTISPTSRTATPRATVPQVRTRRRWPPATPASGWLAVSLPASKPLANRRIDFATSPRPTLGVEWEFALVDSETRDLSNEAATVIAEIGENPHVHKELLRNTVEFVTGVCETTPEAMEDLRSTLVNACEIVRGHGMELFCAGTHPFAQMVVAEADRRAPVCRTDQAHPVVGQTDVDLGSACARGDLVCAQGNGDHLVAAQPLSASAGAVRIVAVLGR